MKGTDIIGIDREWYKKKPFLLASESVASALTNESDDREGEIIPQTDRGCWQIVKRAGSSSDKNMDNDSDGMRRQTDVRREGIVVACLLRLDSSGKEIQDCMNI